ncbi:MFS transporter [Anaeromassilibacillus sp. An200]|uniref:MFS transporter n=1 Tax=Anaeromassilibacillus sp. An200 TaxID=1965587 RepID=UPI000B3A04A6|nr:MFS transporter [Anaeromassilibacillus sp. An200]OUP13262.1 MFS transporter [Anaeromassilibacillus sp. An200]
MKGKLNSYTHTISACFIGYVVQAIIVNFAPLLFLTFQTSYHIPLSRITMLVTVNFGVQLLVDLISAGFVDKIGYRASMLLAHLTAAGGLILLAFLPDALPDPFLGLLIAVVVYAIGGGLLEVLVSPVMESCPTDNKEKAMSLLHSFYCWGQVGVVLLSTVFFSVFGIGNWKILALIWALIPVLNLLYFTAVPIAPLMQEGERGLSVGELFKSRIFWLLLLMMTCAGASEQAVSQWASTFAEQALGVSKTVGDLAGPMAFAVCMGLSRLFYGKYGDRIDLDRFMAGSSLLCVLSYLVISLIPVPALGLIGCALCGLSVGIMWPGTFSKAAASLRGGGTAMFALLALAGDLGCSGGPTLAGMISARAGDNLRAGILAAVVFPVLLLLGLWLLRRVKAREKTVSKI